MNKTEIPSIRFCGFHNAWEQRKFEDAFAERREKTERENEDTLLSCAINGMFLNSELFGHFRGTTTIGYLRVKKNDLILSAQNLHLGNANVNLRFEHGIISPAYKVYDLIDCNPEFIQAWVKKEDTKNFFLAATTEGASQCRKNIEWATLGKQTIAMPSLQEQTELGAFFTHLDNLITLHQRKYEKLQAFKSSMLEKMFPQNGEGEPEVRFKGFVGAWQKTELCKIANKVTEKNVQNLVSETFTNSAEHGIISQRDFFDHDISNAEKINGYYIVQDNDFVYNPRVSVTAPCGPINRNRLGRKGVMSPLYTVFRTHDIDPLFLEWYFQSPHWYAYMRFNGDSGARSDRFSIKNELLFQMPIPFPDIEEQFKIGQALQEISSSIKLHQQELDKLQSLKKGLLEKMFV